MKIAVFTERTDGRTRLHLGARCRGTIPSDGHVELRMLTAEKIEIAQHARDGHVVETIGIAIAHTGT